MPQQEIKPVINLNFSDPTVKELTRFTKFLTENFKTEPNLSITVKVLECLMFVKLNFSWIRYAVINKEKDDTIYKYTQDKVKRVLRAHNDMSFHIIMYEDPEKAISDYSNIISAIENKIDLLLENLAYAKTFIRKIQDSSVGCMEARLELALNFIIDPTIPKLDDLFQDFFAEQTQLGVESEDIDKFIPHLIKYFVKKIGDEYIYDGKNITLSWDEIKYYLNNFFGYDDELKPLNLFNDAIITKKENSYVLHFPSEKMAEKYLNLIQLSLPSDLYFKLKNTKIIKTELVFHNKPNKNFLYTFQLTEEQIHIITILLNTTINNVLSQKDCNLLISSLITTLTNNFEAIKPLIEQYPALKNFIINTDGDLLIHFLVQNNELEQLKVLVKTYRFDINARINKPGTYKHGMTSLNLACYLQNVTTEILEYLLQAGANVNIPSDRGVLPLEQLVYSCNPASKVKIFLDNCKTVPKVNNSLIYAINKNSTEVVAQILSIPEIDINYTNSNGESALFAAAKIGEITKLRLLLNFEHIDLEICDNNGKSAIQIARDNNHPDIAQLILNQLKNKLELKTTLSLRQEHSFFNYARTLHKVPTEDLYISYLKELITFNETEKKINNVTQLEAHFVQSRKLWGDVVSETYLANQQYCQEYAVKEKVIQRLKEMGTKYPIKTYHDAMAYIREDSVLTLSFDAAFLKHGLVDYQPLNIWQRNNKTPDYKKNRDAAERGLFSFLSEPLRTALFDNKDARPRYAAYWLPDKNTTRPHAVSYGSSFLVLKDVVKLNSIFSPGNPIGFKGANQRDYKVCTIHALELLLLQCQPATLQAIINKVTMGELNANNYDQNVIWDKNKGGHFEAMIPAFYFLNPDFVEHIHIDSTRYQLNPEEIAFIKSRGITVSNSPTPPYEELSKKFTNAKKEDINTLLEQYPLLRKIFLQQKLPIHIDELKTLLERLNDSANNQDYKHFIEAWEQLQASGFINEIDRSTTDYFNIFSNTTITLVFEKLVELKDEKIAKLFFDAKLIDIGNLVNNFLYPKYGLTQDSLFYKYINYTVESKDATFFNLLFSQIPKSHRIDFVELFIKECLTCLEKINHFLAYEVLIYLKQNNYLDLEPTLITPESNTILHAVYATHILYSLMHGKLLCPSQINFLENCQLALLNNLMHILMRHHTIDEVRNLINANIIREKLGAQAEEIDRLYSATYLEKNILNYHKELLNSAKTGMFEKFKENWEKIINIYQQDKKQVPQNFRHVLYSILKDGIKGGNIKIVKLMLASNLIDINYLYENKENKNPDEPSGFFNGVSLAVYSGNLSMLAFLYKNSADLDFSNNLQTEETLSPLTIAILKANLPIVNFLLEKNITIWNKEKLFNLSPIQAAITTDVQHNNGSGYYFNLLFNKLSKQSRTELLDKFKTDYLQWLVFNSEVETQWTLNLLLNKDYFDIEDLLCDKTFHNIPVFCPILLEKIIHLNKLTTSQIQFLKKNKKNLNTLVLNKLDMKLFSLPELAQCSKHETIFQILDKDVQKKLTEAFRIEQCKHQPLSLALVKEIFDIANKQLKENKKSSVYREKILQVENFYQAIKKFIKQLNSRFKEKNIDEDTELDSTEIQALLVILEDFRKETNSRKWKKSWYSYPLLFVFEQFSNMPKLSVLTKNVSESALQLSIDKLPTLDEIMKETTEKYEAYISVMCPDIEKAVKEFPSDKIHHALDFILLRINGMPYQAVDITNNELIQKNIFQEDVEHYLQKKFDFNIESEPSFVMVPAEPSNDFPDDFIEVDPMECGAVVVSQKTPELRLNPTLLENLLLSYLEGPASKNYQIAEGFIQVIGTYHIRAYYKKLYQANRVPIFVFQVASDSKNKDQSKNLPFINDVITGYVKQNPEHDAKLLIPLAQCRSQFGIKKQHYILVEVDCYKGKIDIISHNSRSVRSTLLYPNCLNNLKPFSIKNNCYNQQTDNISCGLYVYNYVKSILESGNASKLPTLVVTLNVMISNPSFLEDLLNANFLQMKPDARKIRDYGENFPWEKTLLEEVLHKDYEKKLDDLSRDFDNLNKDKLGAISNNQSSASSSQFASSFFTVPRSSSAEKTYASNQYKLHQ